MMNLNCLNEHILYHGCSKLFSVPCCNNQTEASYKIIDGLQICYCNYIEKIIPCTTVFDINMMMFILFVSIVFISIQQLAT